MKKVSSVAREFQSFHDVCSVNYCMVLYIFVVGLIPSTLWGALLILSRFILSSQSFEDWTLDSSGIMFTLALFLYVAVESYRPGLKVQPLHVKHVS